MNESRDRQQHQHTGTSIRTPPRIRLYEVLVFLFLIVPSMVMSFFTASQANMTFLTMVFAIILRDLALLSLVLFFIWRNNEAFTSLGWTTHNVGKDILIGVFLYIPFFYLSAFLNLLFQHAGLSDSAKTPSYMGASNAAEYLLAFVMVAVAAISEEIIFRGYLILRFRYLTKNVVVAVVLSTFVFAIGHGYEGSAGVATVAFMGFMFALIYIWRGSLVAPIVMHFLQDFIGVIVIPLLGGK